jgi:hypothetical protein
MPVFYQTFDHSWDMCASFCHHVSFPYDLQGPQQKVKLDRTLGRGIARLYGPSGYGDLAFPQMQTIGRTQDMGETQGVLSDVL